jgi:hypothetical protein
VTGSSTHPTLSPCRLYYDADTTVLDGHYLLTPAGSAYLVTRVRPHRTRPGRFNLQCLRWPKADVPEGATIHPLHWYQRKRKQSRLEPTANRGACGD